MIVDYATLRDSVRSWLARADLYDVIPDFITLAHARINRTVFAWQRQAQVAGTSAGGEIPIPTDLYGVQSLRVQRGGRWAEIFPVPLSKLLDCDGMPTGYCISNGAIRLQGGQDTDYELNYWAEIPALSDANPENWVLTREPGLYLYGALIEATPYIKDDARAAIWAAQFQAILADFDMLDAKARYGNAPAMVAAFNAP